MAFKDFTMLTPHAGRFIPVDIDGEERIGEGGEIFFE